MCEWEGQSGAPRGGVRAFCVCQVSVCAGIYGLEFISFAFLLFFLLWVWVGRRPPAPHNQDTGLSGGSYSPFPKLLSQQAVPNVLFSPHISSSLSFYSSVCVFFFFFFNLCLLSHSFLAHCLVSQVSACFFSLLHLNLSLFQSGSLASHITFLGSKKDS